MNKLVEMIVKVSFNEVDSRDMSAEVHIFHPLMNRNGGAERRAVELTRVLERLGPARLWVDREANVQWLPPGLPVSRVMPWLWRYPRGGTLVFVGCYYEVGAWVESVRPRSIIIIVNTSNPEHLRRFTTQLLNYGISCPISVHYASQALADRIGLPGPIDISPIDLDRFTPQPRRTRGSFVVGRLSRPDGRKHHPEDIEIYRCLLAAGCRVRVMGPTARMLEELRNTDVELIPAGRESAETFLASLDSFYYRTDPSFVEPSGRVVFEAMACGLPVVCGPGGYREWMHDGQDSLFVDSTEAALSGLLALAADRTRAAELGVAARVTVERKFSPEAIGELARALRAGGSGRPAHEILEVLTSNGFA